jgi:CRISPR-associated protein Cas6/Cse3/CasE subtype I-E
MFFSTVPRPSVPAYALHQILWTYYPEDHRRPGDDRPFVYRVADRHLLMLSKIPPNCAHQRIDVTTGHTYQFDLICSPVRGTVTTNGHRHRRVRREPYRSNDERREWLKRRLDGAAEMMFCTVTDRPDLSIRASDGRRIHWPECRMQGTLRVTDRTTFLLRLADGVGGRGAWGHGLMYLPEVMK